MTHISPYTCKHTHYVHCHTLCCQHGGYVPVLPCSPGIQEEVSVVGQDGRIYKGRLARRLPGLHGKVCTCMHGFSMYVYTRMCVCVYIICVCVCVCAVCLCVCVCVCVWGVFVCVCVCVCGVCP